MTGCDGFALRGGFLAARAALDELATGEPSFRGSQRQRQREFGYKWRFNRALRWMAGSPAALAVATRLSARWPARFVTSFAKPAMFAAAFPSDAEESAGIERAQSSVW
jgi:hypothetical protein